MKNLPTTFFSPQVDLLSKCKMSFIWKKKDFWLKPQSHALLCFMCSNECWNIEGSSMWRTFTIFVSEKWYTFTSNFFLCIIKNSSCLYNQWQNLNSYIISTWTSDLRFLFGFLDSCFYKWNDAKIEFIINLYPTEEISAICWNCAYLIQIWFLNIDIYIYFIFWLIWLIFNRLIRVIKYYSFVIWFYKHEAEVKCHNNHNIKFNKCCINLVRIITYDFILWHMKVTYWLTWHFIHIIKIRKKTW